MNLLKEEEKKKDFFWGGALEKLKYECSHATFRAIRDFVNWKEVAFSWNTLSEFKISSFQHQETEPLEFYRIKKQVKASPHTYTDF